MQSRDVSRADRVGSGSGRGASAHRSLRSPRDVQLAWVLAVAYLLVILYASLQPFSGWRVPPDEIRRFLAAPWPHYITLEDVLINIAAYVPLGFLLANALATRFGPRHSVLVALVAACLLSTAMEALQSFMPARIASNVDVLTNTLGGLIGALAAPLFGPTHGLGMRLARLRREWFVYGRSADIGLVLVCAWLVTQLHPTAQLFGTGQLRDTLELPVLFFHTPQARVAAEAAVAGFNFLGIGLVVVALTRETMPRVTAIAAVLAAAFAAKAFASFALAKTRPARWRGSRRASRWASFSPRSSSTRSPACPGERNGIGRSGELHGQRLPRSTWHRIIRT